MLEVAASVAAAAAAAAEINAVIGELWLADNWCGWYDITAIIG